MPGQHSYYRVDLAADGVCFFSRSKNYIVAVQTLLQLFRETHHLVAYRIHLSLKASSPEQYYYWLRPTVVLRDKDDDAAHRLVELRNKAEMEYRNEAPHK